MEPGLLETCDWQHRVSEAPPTVCFRRFGLEDIGRAGGGARGLPGVGSPGPLRAIPAGFMWNQEARFSLQNVGKVRFVFSSSL